MHLDHAVCDEIEQVWEQGINDFLIFYKLNLDGKVGALALSVVGLSSMVLAKSGIRPQYRGAGHAAGKKQGEDLLVNEATCRARVFVQVNGDFLRRAGLQHTQNAFVSVRLGVACPRCESARTRNSREEIGESMV